MEKISKASASSYGMSRSWRPYPIFALSPQLVEAGADVTLLCRRNMRRLLCSLPKPVRFIDAIDPNEKFDFQSALLSLPRGFRTTLDTIPARAPYLYAEPDLIAKWAERIGGEGFRIGICWHGNAFINLKRQFSVNFASLAAIKGVRLISLMKDQSRSRPRAQRDIARRKPWR